MDIIKNPCCLYRLCRLYSHSLLSLNFLNVPLLYTCSSPVE